jgi:hypothetical protein
MRIANVVSSQENFSGVPLKVEGHMITITQFGHPWKFLAHSSQNLAICDKVKEITFLSQSNMHDFGTIWPWSYHT